MLISRYFYQQNYWPSLIISEQNLNNLTDKWVKVARFAMKVKNSRPTNQETK